MYKIKRVQTNRYPWTVLHLVDITNGKAGLWLTTVVYANDLCEEYHVSDLAGQLLDQLPDKGEWIDEENINDL